MFCNYIYRMVTFIEQKRLVKNTFLQFETKLDDKLSVSLLPYSRKHNAIIIHCYCI